MALFLLLALFLVVSSQTLSRNIFIDMYCTVEGKSMGKLIVPNGRVLRDFRPLFDKKKNSI